jgi:predicted HTH domain antitoxin
MPKTVVVEVPEAVVEALGGRETELAPQVLRRLVAVLYAEGHFSLREAASYAGMTYWDFMEYLGSLGLGIPYGEKELEEDQATLKRLGLL